MVITSCRNTKRRLVFDQPVFAGFRIAALQHAIGCPHLGF
jgi:hypothetical protein